MQNKQQNYNYIMGTRNKFKYSQLSKKRSKGYRFDTDNDQCTEAYLSAAKKYNQLSHEVEEDIIARIKQGDSDTERLRERLIMSHQPFIIMFAQRHCPLNSDVFMDLIQEGNYGMCMALERFDPSKKVKFITYANAWIVKYMYEFLQNNELIKRKNRSKTWNVDVKVRDEYVRKYGREPTCQELMLIFNEMGIGIKNPLDLGEMKIVPMDQPSVVNKSSDDDDDDSNVLEYGEEDDIVGRLDMSVKAEKLRNLMETVLDWDEYIVLGMKFGFDGLDELSTNEIADFFGESPYKIKSLITSAMKKLSLYKDLFEN